MSTYDTLDSEFPARIQAALQDDFDEELELELGDHMLEAATRASSSQLPPTNLLSDGRPSLERRVYDPVPEDMLIPSMY